MSSLPTIDRSTSRRATAGRLLWPTAIAAFLFTISYPVNDFAPPPSPPDIGFGVLLVYIGIALVTAAVVFALVLPRALRREGSAGVAVTLASLGALFAPAFWTGVPPALAAGGALLGWAGIQATKGRRLSKVAFVIGVLGVGFNIASYADVFI